MADERWQRIQELFQEALKRPPADRVPFVARACGDDAELRAETESLLDHDRTAPDDFMCVPGGVTEEHDKEMLPGPTRSTAHPFLRLPEVEGYHILRMIGKGGMGVVYEAVQEKLSRRVALKLLPALVSTTHAEIVTRFRREATAAAKLHHTNIIPIYDFGESRDGYFYAMELIEGQTLSVLVKRLAAVDAPTASPTALAEILQEPDTSQDPGLTVDAPTPEPSSSGTGSSTTGRGRAYYLQVARWMADAADALHYAHTCGVIHRDIKPSNLILSADGRIMLADFGLAKTAGEESVTVSGSLLGTYRYMSPEQVGAKRVRMDARTDVYSLGATMYELLAFQPAYASTDREELLSQILFKEPLAPRKIVPAVPVELQTICQKAMEKSPDARYASARNLADDLRRFTNDLPIVARPVGLIGRATKFVRRHKAGTVTALSILLLSLTVVLALRYRQHVRELQTTALIREGYEFQKKHQWEKAGEKFRAAMEFDPPRALYNLATAKKDQYYETGALTFLDESDRLLSQALDLAPQDYRLWDLRGVLLRITGDLKGAIAAHKRTLELHDTYYAIWVNLGFALALDSNLVEAEKVLLKGVELAGDSENAMPWRTLAAVQLQLGKAEAFQAIERALAKSKDVDVPTSLLLRAQMRLKLGGHIDVRAALDDAITANTLSGADHRNPRVRRVLALAHLHNEEWSQAAEAAAQALELGDPLPAYAHLIAAVAQAHWGNAQACGEHLQSARGAWPEALVAAGFQATTDRDGSVLWFETAGELTDLRAQAERLLESFSVGSKGEVGQRD